MLRIALAIVVLVATAANGALRAQEWPTRPVTLVVPFAAGGPVDTIARIMAARISELLGQQMVIENVGGAGGLTGSNRVAKAAPDGTTVLLSGSAVLTQNPQTQRNPPYNGATDFAHVGLFSDSARVLIVRKDLPAKSFAAFKAYAKENQNKMQYGSAGAGSGGHICAILLDETMGVTLTHVPYRGAGPAMQDLIAGRIDFMAEQTSTALPQIRGHTVQVFATLGPDRAPGLDEVPSAAELGMKGLDCGAWGAFSFPKGTPSAIVQRLAKASSDAIDTPAVRDRFKSIGVVVTPPERRSPEYLTKFVVSETARWHGPLKAAGMIPE